MLEQTVYNCWKGKQS